MNMYPWLTDPPPIYPSVDHSDTRTFSSKTPITLNGCLAERNFLVGVIQLRQAVLRSRSRYWYSFQCGSMFLFLVSARLPAKLQRDTYIRKVHWITHCFLKTPRNEEQETSEMKISVLILLALLAHVSSWPKKRERRSLLSILNSEVAYAEFYARKKSNGKGKWMACLLYNTLSDQFSLCMRVGWVYW